MRPKQAARCVALLNRRQVPVQDELELKQRVNIGWNFHARARSDLKGNTATLSQGSATLEARILSPEGAHFEVISANPPPPQAQQPDVQNMIIRLSQKTGKVCIAVLFTPGGSGPAPRT
jgi:hypothetical protein